MLWDVDYTLVSADGLGTRLYKVVFREMFGRELTMVAPKAGRTDRAIVADTLALAGVPRGDVDAFLAALERVAAAGLVPGAVRPLPGAAAAIAALARSGPGIRQMSCGAKVCASNGGKPPCCSLFGTCSVAVVCVVSAIVSSSA